MSYAASTGNIEIRPCPSRSQKKCPCYSFSAAYALCKTPAWSVFRDSLINLFEYSLHQCNSDACCHDLHCMHLIFMFDIYKQMPLMTFKIERAESKGLSKETDREPNQAKLSLI
jgi:hypothetical protein